MIKQNNPDTSAVGWGEFANPNVLFDNLLGFVPHPNLRAEGFCHPERSRRIFLVPTLPRGNAYLAYILQIREHKDKQPVCTLCVTTQERGNEKKQDPSLHCVVSRMTLKRCHREIWILDYSANNDTIYK